MESLLDIELPPTVPDTAEETKSLSERELGEISEESEIKDDVIHEDSPKKITITITPSNKLVNNATSPSIIQKAATNTDNLLNINLNFPKATVLGKEQAKKRLQAFSLTKPACSSPIVKKLKGTNQVASDCKEYVGKKKRLSAEEKVESVIKEIEDIRNAQRTDSEEKAANQIESNVKFKDKVKSKWRSTRKYKLPEYREYPQNWQEFNLKNHSLESLKYITQHVHWDRRNSFDYKRHANFEVPALPVSSYKYITLNGEEKSVPYNYVRHTYRSGVSIAYNPNPKLKAPKCYTRKHFFSIIDKSFQEEITKLLNKCSSDRQTETHTSLRNWYPKSPLNPQKKECEVLEQSMGLSILKMYSDEEENDAKITCNDKEVLEDKSHKNKKGRSVTPEHLYEIYRHNRKKRKKVKKNKKMKKNKRADERKDEGKSFQSEYNDKICRKIENKMDPKEEYVEKDANKEFEESIEKNDGKIFIDRLTDSINEHLKCDSMHIIQKSHHEERSKDYTFNINIDHIQHEPRVDDLKTEIDRKAGGYTSHWESDEDFATVPSIRNTQIDCEREKKPTQSLEERSLEMPLTIQTFTRRSYWEEREMLKIKQLEEERKEIQEERKRLEMEKKKLAELEKLYKLNILNNEMTVKPELLDASNLTDVNLKEPEVAEQEIALKIKLEKLSDDDASSRSLNSSLHTSTTSQPSKVIEFPGLNDSLDVVKIKDSNESAEKDQSVLETEYEEFIRDISQQSNDSKKKQTKVKKRRYSSSTSSSSSSDSDASSDSITSMQRECAFDIQPKDDDLDLPEAPIPSLVKDIQMPRPVPVPTIFSLNEIIASNDAAIVHSHIDSGGPVPKQQFTFTKISLPTKKNLLETSAFNDTEDSNHSTYETEDNFKKDLSIKEPLRASESDLKHKESNRSQSIDKERKESYKSKRSRSRDRDVKDHRGDSPRRRRRESPKSYKDSCKRKDYSPRRKRSSPRRSSPRKRDSTPKRNLSPRRRNSPRRRKGRDRSYSPRKNSPRNYMSPRSYSPRSRSPKRSRRNSLSPKIRSMSPSRRNSSVSRKESIQITLQRIAGMEDYSSKSPIDSPLGGFRRSLADSTISDELLMHNSYNESPYNCNYYPKTIESSHSPKRLSLDDRINQVLGIEKEAQKASVNQMYQEYNYGYYDQYGQYQYNEYGTSTNYCDYNTATSTPNKVVQVGNVLQVVPTEDVSTIPSSMNKPLSSQNNKNNKEFQTTPQIVQVGNMLQIVPTELPQTMSTSISSTTAIANTAISTIANTTEKLSAEALMKQKIAEARVEREKRRNERERRRKEKEKKRKEKEKKRQMKLKKKTENMIKRALLLDTEDGENVQENEDAPSQWPPAPIIISTTLKNIGKGILMSHGFGSSNKYEDDEKKKSVKFADGVIPGEGTSPSGGEELTSPPPTPQKLPKEKRFTKTKKPKKIKIPKKKKIKVKIIRTQNISGELDDDDEDNLPPPSPPPGSPPPHIYPPRIKTHAINNLHSSFQANLPTLPINNNFSSYRAPVNTMSHHHHGHHHPHGGHHTPSMHGCPPPGPVIHHPPPGPVVIHTSTCEPCHPSPHCGPPPHHHHAPPQSPHHHHHHHHHH